MNRKTFIATTASLLCLLLTACTTQSEGKEGDNTMSEPKEIILINPFIVPADKLEDTIVMWEDARDFLQTQPGYISTALHQSVTPDSTYRLINVAKWQSADAFKSATAKMNAEADLPRIEGVIANPALYTVIRGD